ncbi:glycosyltransferase family 1 protein [Niallia taxi]|uniref:glycosyltransferase family 4 protein n=1 Tax=Niallia taxi TaxID=2499688 RepID=UPI003D2C9413
MFDATSLARNITGIENYTKNLLLNLINNINKDDQLIVLLRKNVPDYIQEHENVKILLCPFSSQLLCEQVWIPMIHLKYQSDVIHFPAFPPPLLVRKNVYFTVHDATMWKYPNTLSLKNKLYMRPLSSFGIKKARKVLTVSENSKKEIIDVFPNVSKKIENMGISISTNISRETDKEKLLNVKIKYKLPEKFLLTVGSLEPRKNLLFLIKSFTKYCKDNNETELKLVITGRSAWGATEVISYIKNNEMENQIILTGYISDSDLICLYSLCEYFVFPSIYEGFGLPVLEAMACGSPLIVSNTSSIPEVAGEAAVYFNPYEQEDFVEKLNNVYLNEEIKKSLIIKGSKRVKKFSWEKISKDIYNLYKINAKKGNGEVVNSGEGKPL